MKYDNKCAYCHKVFKQVSYASDRHGTVPQMFCGGTDHETLYKNSKRMENVNKFSSQDQHKKLFYSGRLFGMIDNPRTVNLNERISNIPWNNDSLDNQGYDNYITEEVHQ